MARALIVIDVQKDYFEGGSLPLWNVNEIEQRIADTIKRSRDRGDKIILVRHISKSPSGLFAQGSVGSEISPLILSVAEDAPVVVKHVADAFQDTDLLSHLGECDELLLCGMMTQNCVAFTALSRSADRFRILVASELCTAPSEIVHKIALNALASKVELVEQP
ncbi:isochorismatase family protein [Thioclava sp. GXIMD4216]|uniref:isochorismatase family protein n=1 Tax=unclassified Thioclava TaxID=2621713 RepID=UPI0030CC637C